MLLELMQLLIMVWDGNPPTVELEIIGILDSVSARVDDMLFFLRNKIAMELGF